ncbi:MAG: hypothetical protein AB7O73_08065 [Bacteroidia bacterium]
MLAKLNTCIKALLFAFCIFALCSCNSKDTEAYEEDEYTKESLFASINHPILAAFNEKDGFSIIYKANNNLFLEAIYHLNHLAYIDTLDKTNVYEFYSKKFNTTYYIKDSSVIAIERVKIFHPNSNLKGQTPWEQPYVYFYKRWFTKFCKGSNSWEIINNKDTVNRMDRKCRRQGLWVPNRYNELKDTVYYLNDSIIPAESL